MSILNLYRLQGNQVRNLFRDDEEFDLAKHCSKGKIPQNGNWSLFKHVHKYIMMSCVQILLKKEDGMFWVNNIDKVSEKYRVFKKSNVGMTSEESAKLEAAYATCKLVEFHQELMIPGMPVDLKKFKTLLGLFEKQSQPVLQIEILGFFYDTFGTRSERDVQKFLILFMSKIYSKLKSSRADGDLKKKLNGNLNLTIGDELTILCLCINFLKLSLMKDILERSATVYNYEKDYKLNDRSGNFLKSLLGSNVDDDFMDVPLIVTSYQEAEIFSKTLSKICSEGLEVYNKNLGLMKRIAGKCKRISNYESLKLYYNGFVYRQTAKFVSNLKKRVKFLDRAIQYLEELINKRPHGSRADEIFSMATLFADDCYGMSWKTWKQIHEKEPTPENLEALEKSAKYRMEKGEILVALVQLGLIGDDSFAYILFDMMYCCLTVLKEGDKPDQLARDLAKYILRHPEKCETFTSHFNIDVDRYDDHYDPVGKLSRHLIIKTVMIKCI